MTGIKDQLEAAGYDTQGLDESSMLQKLDQAGYDTSSLAPAAPSMLDRAKGALKTANTVGAAMNPLLAPFALNKEVHSAADEGGAKIAESLASSGVHPNLAAAVGTSFSMLPNALETAAGGEGVAPELKAAGSAVGDTLGAVKTALTPGGRAALGKQIGAAEAAAGIKPNLPTVSNLAKKLDLPARERSFADIVTNVKSKLDSGEEIAAQDLSDFRDLVKQKFAEGKIARGTRMEAHTSDANKKAGQVLNELIPARAAASMKYAKVARIQNGLKTLAKAGGAASGIGLSGALLRYLIKD
jgi:hypothetical protein